MLLTPLFVLGLWLLVGWVCLRHGVRGDMTLRERIGMLVGVTMLTGLAIWVLFLVAGLSLVVIGGGGGLFVVAAIIGAPLLLLIPRVARCLRGSPRGQCLCGAFTDLPPGESCGVCGYTNALRFGYRGRS